VRGASGGFRFGLASGKTTCVEYRILGPLEVRDGGRFLSLGTAKQQALLAVLLLHANEFVPREQLIDELWGATPPPTAAKAIQVYVSHLRKLLATNGAEAIGTRAGGYVLSLDGEGVDALRFERIAGEAREHAAAGDAAKAASHFREALALWRGPALAGLSFESAARNEVERLEEERLAALMDRIDCDLSLGRHEQLVGELEGLVAQHPLRERLRSQLMLALYRSGRQADALRVYREGRETLVEELGLEPSEPLQRLERAILVHDPALEVPAGLARAKGPEPAGGRRGQSNLPAQPTPFVGRGRELAEVLSLLARDDLRLLTLTGPGGSGKTRLALAAAGQVADDYESSVCWVALAALREPALVVDSVSQALGTRQELAKHLADKQMLLLLDNFEHLLDAAPRVAELLAACPNLKLLVTSREPLHLAGEREYLVPVLAEQEALELFRQRAQTAEPEQAVLAICCRLDCLPLAVELAAARTKLLRPEALLRRLDKRLPMLTGGPRDAPERQRTLEAAIAWSYDLLNETERLLFARLAVFVGGFTLEAAERACDADLDTLQSLVDKNLLHGDGDRYQMLETIREYATDRLEEAHDPEVVHRRHAEHFLTAAKAFAFEREWPHEPASEVDNVRAALRWAIAVEDSALALRLAIAFFAPFLFLNPAEGRRWVDEALALGDPNDLELRAKALQIAGALSNESGDYDAAVEFQKRSIVSWQTLDDRRSMAYSLVLLAQNARGRGQMTSARALLVEALEIFEGLSDVEGACFTLRDLGALERQAGNSAKARGLLERALSLAPDELRTALIFHSLGDVALNAEELDCAEKFYRDSLVMVRQKYRQRDIAFNLAGLSAVAAAQGQVERAGRLVGAVERFQESREAPLFGNPSYRRLLEATPIEPEDVAAGRAMTLDEAVAYALELDD
jgi:predicted ATPase/DNA-binding SARP family transcriptional activator